MNAKNELPNAFSLFGTEHFPPIDNQGAIGSCASQSITRNQFSNAVSRLLHSKDPKSTFSPRDRMNERFSPKFSYNMSGAGTAWVYEFLMDHGALFQDEVNFKKNEKTNGSLKVDEKGELYTESSSFSVAPGQMERAMKYRVTGFEQIWFTGAPYSGRFTTCQEGVRLSEKIKRALLGGDAVVTGGYPARWVFAKVENRGTLGKEGDEAIVAAAGNGGGGHQVTIVGYDDDLTAVFAGVRLRGAFLVANSYGVTWKNEGLCWLMYDAVNTVSAYDALNDPALYSGPMYLTPSDEMKMYPTALTDKEQILDFKESGVYSFGGKNYPAYYAKDRQSGKYLGYDAAKEQRGIFLSDAPAGRFAFIPYEEMMARDTSDRQYYKEEYAGSFWIYAVDKETDEEGYRVVDAGVSFTASGRKVNFATHNAGRYPEAKSFLPDCAPAGDFSSRLAIAAGKGVSSERTWVMDQFCFLDWRKDVTVGMPPLYVKARVRADDRCAFTLTLFRMPKGGRRAKRYMPAVFRYAACHPDYCSRKAGEYVNFDGVKNGKAVIGEFALSFLPLLDLPKGKKLSDYVWGVEIRRRGKGTAELRSAELRGMKGNRTRILAAAKAEKNEKIKKFTFTL